VSKDKIEAIGNAHEAQEEAIHIYEFITEKYQKTRYSCGKREQFALEYVIAFLGGHYYYLFLKTGEKEMRKKALKMIGSVV